MMFPKPPTRAVNRRQPRIEGKPVPMGELRAHVLIRDGWCILASTSFPGHVCEGRFPRSGRLLDEDFSLEHVVGVHGPEDVRRDDDEHCVALCVGTNIRHTDAAEREWIRDLLRRRYPFCRQLPSARGSDG